MNFTQIAIMYSLFAVLFGWIGLSYNEPIAKAISVTFVLGMILSIQFEINSRLLEKMK